MPFPSKQLVERPVNSELRVEFIESGLEEWLATLLSRRVLQFVDPQRLRSPALADIRDPAEIPSMSIGVERVVRAIRSGEKIVLACDHDMDGTASAAVLWSALTKYFGVAPARIRVVTSHRLTEGYGITVDVVDRILEDAPGLVISADKGSSDEPRIRLLKQAGIDVVVTDHHQVPDDGPPLSALAVVNPARKDSNYDPTICGAAVAFMLMAKVRTSLIESGSRSDIPSMSELLDYVAVATIADCVSLSPSLSYINRALVKRGLIQINTKSRPCWSSFCRANGVDTVDVDMVGFKLVPAIAAAGRLDWAEVGFRFLVADTIDAATEYWTVLQRENDERKKIEGELRVRAIERALRMRGASIVLYFDDGHAGVHGITASRLVEMFGKPAAMFSPKGNGARGESGDEPALLATGSFRSVPGLDVNAVLKAIAREHRGLLISHGGHAGAAGATISIANIARFAKAFEKAVIDASPDSEPRRPVVFTDGILDMALHTLDTVKALDEMGPWGRGFDYPVFSGVFRLTDVKRISDGKHIRFGMERDGYRLTAIWFNYEDAVSSTSMNIGQRLTLAYRIKANSYRGRQSLDVVIVGGSVVQ